MTDVDVQEQQEQNESEVNTDLQTCRPVLDPPPFQDGGYTFIADSNMYLHASQEWFWSADCSMYFHIPTGSVVADGSAIGLSLQMI